MSKIKARDIFYIYDMEVSYKDIKFYPVTMRDYFPLSYYAECLMLEKNSVPDPKIITMSYLDYLYYSADKENNNLLKLHSLLCLSLKRDLEVGKDVFYGYDKNGKALFKIDEIVFSGQDFDEVKEIISDMNDIKLPDENIQKEIRDSIKLSKKLKSGSTKMAGMEDLMIAVSISTGFELNYIYDLPVRKFSKMLERLDAKLHYKLYLQASLSGMVEFKDKSFIKHWLSDLTTNDLETELMSLEDVENKIAVNGK
jgi:hypothetical protein